MNNFKEIAEKCLKGELSGTFILRNDARIPSRRLYKRTANFIITDPYVFNGLPYTYGDTGTRYPTYEEEYDVINFIPDMEERNVKLTLEKAKEWYKKGGELKEVALQAYTEEELKEVYRPRSWNEYAKQMGGKRGYYITMNSRITYTDGFFDNECDKNTLPTKELAEAFLAYMQIMSLYKAWIGEWEPNWLSDQPKFCIEIYANHLTVGENYNVKSGLPFPTRELAKDFLNTFRDLIENTKSLL
jgi:hypothetical protein